MTTFAGLRNVFSSPSAFWTGLLHREKPLGNTHLTIAITGRTNLYFRARLCTCSATYFAGTPTGHSNLGGVALSRLLQGNLHVVAQIYALINLGPRTSTLSKDVTKDVTKGIRKTASARPSKAAHTGVYSSMTILIICATLLRI